MQVETDENGRVYLELRDGVTEVEKIGAIGSNETLDSSDEGDEKVADGAVADGGQSAVEPDGDTDESGEFDTNEIDQAKAEDLELRGGCSLPKLSAAVATKHDYPPDKVRARVEKMLERGDLIDQTGGERETLIWSG